MVKVIVGDIFESKAQTLVNTVNCVGVMGKGVALGFKKRFSEMYEDYAERCRTGKLKLGQPQLYRRLVPPWILNFPTKDHWRSVSRLKDIVRGLEYLEKRYKEWGITSLAVPPLGCGHGQLEWRVVGPTLYRHLNRLSIPVELYAPYGTSLEELQPEFLERAPDEVAPAADEGASSRIRPAWIALVEILARVEKEPYHRPIGRTSFQKIAYFATESGIPTGLEHRRSSYGPYAPQLKKVTTKLVNNCLIREERLGRMFAVKVGPTFGDAQTAFGADLARWQEAINRIADLFMRMRTKDAELAATVHFAAKSLAEKSLRKSSERDVLAEVLSWKQRRRPPLNEADVALSIRSLSLLRWLDLTASSDLPLSEEDLLGA